MVLVMERRPAWDSVTAVAVVEDEVPTPALVSTLGTELASVASDSEIVLIANGVSADAAQRLRDIAEAVPDVTVHFVAHPVDRDTALLVGIDHALGDWIVVLSPTAGEVAALPQVLRHAGPFEVIFAGARAPDEIPWQYRGPARWYFRAYEVTTGIVMDWPAPRVRVYSRAAARYLASHLDGEFMLRSLNFSGAFPGTRVMIHGLPTGDLQLPTAWAALRKASRGLLNANAVVLRGVGALALLTASFALLTSIYAVATYLLKEDVAPGWTTLSLQIAVMMFLFSGMFALLAEYVLNVYRSTPLRRRVAVVRELRSPGRRQGTRLNVIGADSAFQLGAPKGLHSRPEQG